MNRRRSRSSPAVPALESLEVRTLLASALDQINAAEAQALVDSLPRIESAGGPIVAILDTAIDLTRPEIAAALWRNPGEIAGNGIDDEGDGYVDDVHGWNCITDTADVGGKMSHGTRVALCVLLVCPTATILPVVMITPQRGDFAWSTGAFEYLDSLESSGIDIGVVNCSWQGGWRDPQIQQIVSTDQWVTVAASGNDGADYDQWWATSPTYPSDYPLVVSVAAVDSAGRIKNYSRRGGASPRFDGVEIAAPGTVELTGRNGRPQSFSRTSAASPLAAGAVALMLTANADATPDELRQALYRSAAPGGTVSGAQKVVWGVVDCEAAVELILS
jgi:hypothetical protein